MEPRSRAHRPPYRQAAPEQQHNTLAAGWGERGGLETCSFSRPAIGISRKLIAVNGLIKEPSHHGPGRHPFRDLSGSGSFPPVIGRCLRRYLSAPRPKKRLLPFHLVLPCGCAVVFGSGRSLAHYHIALPPHIWFLPPLRRRRAGFGFRRPAPRWPAKINVAVSFVELMDTAAEAWLNRPQPPPVSSMASDPRPAGAMPDPGSGDPYRVNVGRHHVRTWPPDILDAVPAPVTRPPDVAGARRSGYGLDHRSGRGNTDYDPDAGEAGNGGEGQSRGARNGKGRASAHRRVPGEGFVCPEQSTERGSVGALTAVNNFPLFVFSPGSANTDPVPFAPHDPLEDIGRSCVSPETGGHYYVRTGI